jgi:hypothetical protein
MSSDLAATARGGRATAQTVMVIPTATLNAIDRGGGWKYMAGASWTMLDSLRLQYLSLRCGQTV